MTNRRPPRVGLTTYREDAAWGVWRESADLLPASYADSIARAGGVPLLLPPAGFHDCDRAAYEVVSGLHGLLLAGGPDVDPIRYGAVREPHTGASRPGRDQWELALVSAALAADIPVLAVCRGMQVLNVALGGDLVQHLPDVVGHDAHCPVLGLHGRHEVTLCGGTRIGSLLGRQRVVATYHHQGVGQLAAQLRPTARAADGTIEAVEHQSAAWVVGVQWHPEVTDGEPLFAGFVGACAGAQPDSGARA